MRRFYFCRLDALLMALSQTNSAWSYTLELQYIIDSNLADPYARKTTINGAVYILR